MEKSCVTLVYMKRPVMELYFQTGVEEFHESIFLLGDPAYPLTSWLMKPFPHTTHLSRQQRKFNQQLSRARVVVENAFGRLKGRWRCLLKKNKLNMPKIVSCCIVLHNIREIFGEECPDEWMVLEPPSTDHTDSTISHT